MKIPTMLLWQRHFRARFSLFERPGGNSPCSGVPAYQGCGVGVGDARSRRFVGGVGVGFLRTLEVGVGFFVRLRKSNWIIFTSHY